MELSDDAKTIIMACCHPANYPAMEEFIAKLEEQLRQAQRRITALEGNTSSSTLRRLNVQLTEGDDET